MQNFAVLMLRSAVATDYDILPNGSIVILKTLQDCYVNFYVPLHVNSRIEYGSVKLNLALDWSFWQFFQYCAANF